MRIEELSELLQGKKCKALRLSLSLALLFLFFASFQMGRYSSLSFFDPLRIIVNHFVPLFERTWDAASETVVLQLRLPRIIGAIVVGASLAISGASYQALFGNPIASSDTLGVGSAASFGAVLGIMIGLSSIGSKLTAFIVGCLAVGLVFVTARRLSGGRSDTLYLLLVGMIVSSVFSALLSILKYIADPIDQLPQITYWLLGSLSNITWADIPYATLVFFIAFVPLVLLRWRLNLLMLSEKEARAIGQNIVMLRGITVACATLLTSSAIAITGGISWIGLVVPHACRSVVGDDMSKLLPLCTVSGALFLLFVDNLARTATAYELPISILTSIVGAPLFFFLLLRQRRRGEIVD